MQCWWLLVDHMKHSFEVLLLINFQLESFNQRFMLKISVDDLCASPQVIFANIWVLIDTDLILKQQTHIRYYSVILKLIIMLSKQILSK